MFDDVVIHMGLEWKPCVDIYLRISNQHHKQDEDNFFTLDQFMYLLLYWLLVNHFFL